MNRGAWFLSASGKQIFPADLRPEDVQIEDIAHSLSNLCRFQGHCRTFYSVAQHSVIVAENVSPEHRLAGLLHDATEAYCGDVIRPIKRNLPQFRNLESGIWRAVRARFDLPTELPDEVKVADNRLLLTERRDLMAPHPWPWLEDQASDGSAEPFPFTLSSWSPEEARLLFLETFREEWPGT